MAHEYSYPRKLIPWQIRERLYEWNPRRRSSWRRWPGLRRVRCGAHAALTFDDGPDRGTLDVLDALDRADARATFFVLGEQVERHPAILREITRRGHELGVHGYSHVRLDRLRPEETQHDIARTVARLDALGCSPRWFRPPYGRPTAAAYATCRDLGLELVYWTTSGADWVPRTAGRIAGSVRRRLGGGAIVLLHDSAKYAERGDVRPTADAIGLIAADCRERGLRLLTLGEALDEG